MFSREGLAIPDHKGGEDKGYEEQSQFLGALEVVGGGEVPPPGRRSAPGGHLKRRELPRLLARKGKKLSLPSLRRRRRSEVGKDREGGGVLGDCGGRGRRDGTKSLGEG